MSKEYTKYIAPSVISASLFISGCGSHEKIDVSGQIHEGEKPGWVVALDRKDTGSTDGVLKERLDSGAVQANAVLKIGCENIAPAHDPKIGDFPVHIEDEKGNVIISGSIFSNEGINWTDTKITGQGIESLYKSFCDKGDLRVFDLTIMKILFTESIYQSFGLLHPSTKEEKEAYNVILQAFTRDQDTPYTPSTDEIKKILQAYNTLIQSRQSEDE